MAKIDELKTLFAGLRKSPKVVEPWLAAQMTRNAMLQAAKEMKVPPCESLAYPNNS